MDQTNNSSLESNNDINEQVMDKEVELKQNINLIENPFISKAIISFYDEKTDETIDINSENVHKYYKTIYILIKTNKIKIPSEFYRWHINEEVYNDVKKNLIIYKMNTTILNNKSHFNNIIVLSNEQLKEFNIYNYDLEQKNIVIPILNIEYKEIIQYLQQYEDIYTLKKLYNLVLLNQYFNNSKKKDIIDYILNLDDTNSWTNKSFINITQFFKNRDFSYQYKKLTNKHIASFYKSEFKKNNVDDGNYLSEVKNYYCTMFDNYVFPKKTDLSKEDINNLFSVCNNKERYMLFFYLMVNKRYSHLVINNLNILTIMKTTYSKYARLFKYLLSYTWMQYYFEETKKKNNIKHTDTFIFNINTASELPLFHVAHLSPKSNPYLPLMVDNTEIPSNNVYGILSTNEADFEPKGICKLDKFKKNLNIFCTNDPNNNLFDGIDFDKLKIGITGSVITACIQNRHPLMGIFNSGTTETETFINYLNEFYVDADIDVMFQSSNDMLFIDNVKIFYNKIKENLIKFNHDIKPENIKLNFIRKNYLFVSKDFVEKNIVIPEKTITNKIKYITKNIDEPEIKELFKPHFDKMKKVIIENAKQQNITNYPEIYDIDDETEFMISIKEYMKNNNEIDLEITHKFNIESPYLNHRFELFPVRGDDFFSIVGTFHLPCVRSYYDGNDLYLTPSCISSHLTFMNLDYRYIAGSKDPIDIINKYRMRGFGTFLNKTEIKSYNTYSTKIPFWKNLLGDGSLTVLNFNHKLFRPRMYNVDTYINSNYVELDNRYNAKIAKNQNNVDTYGIVGNQTSIKSMHINMNTFSSIRINGNIVPLQKWLILALWELTNDN